MRTIYGLNNLKCQREESAVTIGIFDGVHAGHQKILKEVVRQAKGKKFAAVAITFYPHPQNVLDKIPPKSTIISLKHRLKLLEDMGINLCVVIRFTKAFSERAIEWFIGNVLIEKLKTKVLIVGSGFKLGKGGMSAERLKRLILNYGINLKIIPAQKYNGNVISSSIIRNLIEKGKLDIASKLLGRSVTIYGTVIPGERRGRTIGFKTANIDPHHEVIPPSGVYVVKAKVKGRLYNGLLNIGFRPTFKVSKKPIEGPIIEVYLLNFDGCLYNENIEVSFIKKIRAEKRFKDKKALAEQIKRDIRRAYFPFTKYNTSVIITP